MSEHGEHLPHIHHANEIPSHGEHLPHIHHLHDIPADFDAHSKVTLSKKAYPVKLKSIADDLHGGIAAIPRGKLVSESLDSDYFESAAHSQQQNPQPPFVGKQSKSLQAKIYSRGNSEISKIDHDIVNRNGLVLEPLDNTKKILPSDKPPPSFVKQSSFETTNNKNKEKPVLEKKRSFSAKEKAAESAVRQRRVPPRIEEEGTIYRQQLTDMQQSHQRRRKERPLYMRMVSRAQKKRLDEDRRKAEEYAELKKLKIRNNPLRVEIKEHMNKVDEQAMKWKQDAILQGRAVAPPSSKAMRNSDVVAVAAKLKSYNQQQQLQQQQFSGASDETGGRFISRKVSNHSDRPSTHNRGDFPDSIEDEDFYDDEEDEDSTYAIRRRDEAVTIPVFSTNSIVTFCADDWVNKLLEIESLEKIKLTEVDYLLS